MKTRRNLKTFLPFLIIFILLVLLKNNIASLLNSLQNGENNKDLKNQLLDEQRKNEFLKERLLYVKTSQFVEEQAQEKLGMTKTGEYFVIAPTSTPPNQEIIVIDQRPNWKKWIDLFL